MNNQINQAQALEWYKYFGLFDENTKQPVPLRKFLVNTKINEYIAEVVCSQTFYNNSEYKIETEYYFPISPEACFHSFQAKFGEKIVQGGIKEKQAAQEQYNVSLQEGDIIAYAKLCSKGKNIMSVKIGNIPPSTEIEVVFCYFERVEVYLNKFYKFKVLSFLFDVSSEARKNQVQIQDALDNIPDPERLFFELSVTVNSRTPITFIKSISHEVEIAKCEIGNSYSSRVSLLSNKRYLPNKDFVLLYTTRAINQPHYLLSPFEYGYCMLLNFVPNLSYLTFDDTFRAANQGKLLSEVLIAQARREFIFIIDETNSRDEPALSLMKETLLSFIRKLPDGSYFNILGINQTSITYSDKSVRITEEVLSDIVRNLDSGYQDLGSVSVERLILMVEKQDYIEDYSRKVFILTSKMSERPINDTIQMVKNKLPREEVFVIEIKPSSLQTYSGKVAVDHKVIYEIVDSVKEIDEKVTHLLRNSMLPHFTDFDLKIEDESLCAYVIPLPRALSYITLNKLVEFFIIFNKKLEDVKKTDFTLKFFNSQNNRYDSYNGEINIENADLSEGVIKLGMYKFCESLSAKEEIFKAMKNEMAKEFEKDVSEKLLATSLKHGILTNKTAFVCQVQDGDDVLRQIPSQKITVSQIKAIMRARETLSSIATSDLSEIQYLHRQQIEYDTLINLNLFDDPVSHSLPAPLLRPVTSKEPEQTKNETLNNFSPDDRPLSRNLRPPNLQEINPAEKQSYSYNSGFPLEIRPNLSDSEKDLEDEDAESSGQRSLSSIYTIQDLLKSRKSQNVIPTIFELLQNNKGTFVEKKVKKERWKWVMKIIKKLCPCKRRKKQKVPVSQSKEQKKEENFEAKKSEFVEEGSKDIHPSLKEEHKMVIFDILEKEILSGIVEKTSCQTIKKSCLKKIKSPAAKLLSPVLSDSMEKTDDTVGVVDSQNKEQKNEENFEVKKSEFVEEGSKDIHPSLKERHKMVTFNKLQKEILSGIAEKTSCQTIKKSCLKKIKSPAAKLLSPVLNDSMEKPDNPVVEVVDLRVEIN